MDYTHTARVSAAARVQSSTQALFYRHAAASITNPAGSLGNKQLERRRDPNPRGEELKKRPYLVVVDLLGGHRRRRRGRRGRGRGAAEAEAAAPPLGVREWTHGNLQRAVAPPEEGGGGGEGRGGRRPGGAEHAAGERHCLASLLRLKEFWGRRLLTRMDEERVAPSDSAT